MEVHQSSLFETQMAKDFARLLDHAKMNSMLSLMSKYCVNGRIPWPWVLYIIYRLYKDATHGKQIKANKFPHDSSPIHVNYNLSNNICYLYRIINGEIRKQLWAKIRKEVWTAKLSFDTYAVMILFVSSPNTGLFILFLSPSSISQVTRGYILHSEFS